MFFCELSELSKFGFSQELINQLDKWLAFLPKIEKESITASALSRKIELDYTICETLLVKLEEMGILEENYIIICPECEREIEVISKKELLDKMDDIKYCFKCDCEIELSKSDIYRSYKLIKIPSASEEMLRTYTKSILQVKKDLDVISEENSLETLILEGKKDVNDFFMIPLKRKRRR